jgi:hypothetical protein
MRHRSRARQERACDHQVKLLHAPSIAIIFNPTDYELDYLYITFMPSCAASVALVPDGVTSG